MVPIKIKTETEEYNLELHRNDADLLMKDPSYRHKILMELKKSTGNNNNKKTVTTDKTEKKNWSRAETLALLKLIEKYYDDTVDPDKKRKIYKTISDELQQSGIEVTPKNCTSKWKNMLRTYRNVKKSHNITGCKSKRFDFYDQMDEILRNKPIVLYRPIAPKPPTSRLLEKGEILEVSISDESCESYTEQAPVPVPQPPKESKGPKRPNVELSQEYLRLKQREWLERRKEKQIRHAERVKLQLQKLELEEKKIALLERYLSKKHKK